MLGYGEINIAAPAAPQSPTTTPAPLVGWANNGPQASVGQDVAPDQANNRVKAIQGTYRVTFSASLSLGGAAAAGDLIFQLGKAGVAQAKATSKITATTTTAKNTVGFECFLTVGPGDLTEINTPNAPTWDPRFPQGMNVCALNILVSSSVAGGIAMTVEAATLCVTKME